MSVEIIPHTADVRMRVSAPSLEELFREALRGMMSIIKTGAPEPAGKEIRKIKISASGQTELLIDFLNEALSLSQINKEIYPEAGFRALSKTDLEADLRGMPVDSFDEDIKAVTYHGAEIVKDKKGNWEATILFDI